MPFWTEQGVQIKADDGAPLDTQKVTHDIGYIWLHYGYITATYALWHLLKDAVRNARAWRPALECRGKQLEPMRVHFAVVQISAELEIVRRQAARIQSLLAAAALEADIACWLHEFSMICKETGTGMLSCYLCNSTGAKRCRPLWCCCCCKYGWCSMAQLGGPYLFF